MREMRDSGVAWIGEIPSDWSLVRFKDKFVNVKEIAKERSAEFERLALTLNGVIKRPKDDSEGLQPKEFDGYQILRENDFIFKMIDLQNISTSRVGLSPYTGLVSPAYIRFSPKKENQYNQFVYYYLMSLYYNCVYNNLGGNGVRSALNAGDMGEFLMPYPEEFEQRKICAFLDKKRSQVDALIANVQAQIEKLKAYKQSLITEVVTKGLDPTVPMKDSGVDWVPQIPTRWEMSRVGLHYTIILGKMLCPNQIDDSYTLEKYYCAANVHFGEINSDELKEMWFSPSEKEQYRIYVGDMLIVEGGAGAGGCAIVDQNTNALVQNSVMIVRNRNGVDNRYLRYWIESMVKRGYLDVVCNKATIPHYTKEKLAKTIIPLLPQNEQMQIADFLDKKCSQVDRLIALKEAKIKKLEQYKKSLIYEYVTGKREV